VVPNIEGLVMRQRVPEVHAHSGTELAITDRGAGGTKVAGS
jgi:hypothetical protein